MISELSNFSSSEVEKYLELQKDIKYLENLKILFNKNVKGSLKEIEDFTQKYFNEKVKLFKLSFYGEYTINNNFNKNKVYTSSETKEVLGDYYRKLYEFLAALNSNQTATAFVLNNLSKSSYSISFILTFTNKNKYNLIYHLIENEIEKLGDKEVSSINNNFIISEIFKIFRFEEEINIYVKNILEDLISTMENDDMELMLDVNSIVNEINKEISHWNYVNRSLPQKPNLPPVSKVLSILRNSNLSNDIINKDNYEELYGKIYKSRISNSDDNYFEQFENLNNLDEFLLDTEKNPEYNSDYLKCELDDRFLNFRYTQCSVNQKQMQDFYFENLLEEKLNKNCFTDIHLRLKLYAYSKENRIQIMEKIRKNIERIKFYIDKFIFNLMKTNPPNSLKWLISVLWDIINKLEINDFEKHSIVSEILISNIYLPSLINPEFYSVLNHSPLDKTIKNLNLISKILLGIFRTKFFTTESELSILNFYMIEIIPNIYHFIENLKGKTEIKKIIGYDGGTYDNDIFRLYKEVFLDFNKNLDDKGLIFLSKNLIVDILNIFQLNEKYFENNSFEEDKRLKFTYFSLKYNIKEIFSSEPKTKDLEIFFIFSNINELYGKEDMYQYFCSVKERPSFYEYEANSNREEKERRSQQMLFGNNMLNKRFDKRAYSISANSDNYCIQSGNHEEICDKLKFCLKEILKRIRLISIQNTKSSNSFIDLLSLIKEIPEEKENNKEIPLFFYYTYLLSNCSNISLLYKNNNYIKFYEEIKIEVNQETDKLKSNKISVILLFYSSSIQNQIKNINNSINTYIEKHRKRCLKYFFINAPLKLRLFESLADKSLFLLEETAEINSKKKNKNNKKFNNTIEYISKNIIEFIENFTKLDMVKNCLKNYEKYMETSNNKKLNFIEIFDEFINIIRRRLGIYKKEYFLFLSLIESKGEQKIGDSDIIDTIKEYIIEEIYVKIWGEQIKSDIDFYDKTIKNKEISTNTLGIQSKYMNKKLWRKAKKYLYSLDFEKTPKRKLKIIEKIYVSLNQSLCFMSGRIENYGFDDIFPIFLYIIIQCSPKFFISNLNFIKLFLGDRTDIGNLGFNLSQLEMAVSYIKNL